MSVSLKKFILLYYGVAAVFLTSLLFDLQFLHYLVKPLFMILLMVFHHSQLSEKTGFFSKMIQFGLFFSWLGDIALMFDEKVEILFVFGLAFFLIAHLGYVLAFLRNLKDSKTSFNRTKSVAISVPFIIFISVFFYFIKDELPADLFVPVLAYTIVICLMGITAAIRHYHVSSKSYNWILLGAILFILSDCVIAINKFVVDFEYDAVLNMLLYMTGQLMITVGAVYYAKSLNPDSTDS